MRLVRIEGKMTGAKYREILDENLLQSEVGTADWDRDWLNMSVNTPASWSAYALRKRLWMPSGPAALRGLTRLNVLLTLAEGELTGFGSGPCQWHCIVLKASKEVV